MIGKCAKCMVVPLRMVKHVSDVNKTANTSRVLADCAKTAAAEKLYLEEEEWQGENFSSIS